LNEEEHTDIWIFECQQGKQTATKTVPVSEEDSLSDSSPYIIYICIQIYKLCIWLLVLS